MESKLEIAYYFNITFRVIAIVIWNAGALSIFSNFRQLTMVIFYDSLSKNTVILNKSCKNDHCVSKMCHLAF